MMKYTAITLLFAAFFLAGPKSQAQNRIVQGSLMQNYSYGAYQTVVPLSNIPVTIFSPVQNVRSSPSLTDIYGRYYFYNIPDGQYQLEIWIYGMIDIPNRFQSARIYNVSVSYQQAYSYNQYLVMNINPINISN